MGMRKLVIDSDLSHEQAMGGDTISVEAQQLHAKMKPYLRVVRVYYLGFDDCLHAGQIVVYRGLVEDTKRLFSGMLALGFPIESVIPQSQFDYKDERSMVANNSSSYRPQSGSEHCKGTAVDLNPRVNPMIVTDAGIATVDPPGAHYDPNAKGALIKEGAVRKLWTAVGFEWGGNWGDPRADPAADFYKIDYFDYQHFELNSERSRTLQLPSDI